jgi:hypothetical protein
MSASPRTRRADGPRERRRPRSTRARGAEWLRRTFAAPVRAKELRIRQSFDPGTVSKVTPLVQGGRALVVFRGVDANVYPAGQVVWFVVRFPPTDFAVEASSSSSTRRASRSGSSSMPCSSSARRPQVRPAAPLQPRQPRHSTRVPSAIVGAFSACGGGSLWFDLPLLKASSAMHGVQPPPRVARAAPSARAEGPLGTSNRMANHAKR